MIFAPPVEHDGLKVIAVAKIRWGLGGGFGKEGSRGGGGGVWISPVGYNVLNHPASRDPSPISAATAQIATIHHTARFVLGLITSSYLDPTAVGFCASKRTRRLYDRRVIKPLHPREGRWTPDGQ
jgi:hypothetical protein